MLFGKGCPSNSTDLTPRPVPAPVGPDRMVRVEAQEPLPQTIDHRRQRHGSRMAAVRLLRRIHRESADGVDAQFVYGATASKIRHSPFTLSAVILTLSLDKNIYHRDAEAAEKKL